jgi:hypothetical protein
MEGLIVDDLRVTIIWQGVERASVLKALLNWPSALCYNVVLTFMSRGIPPDKNLTTEATRTENL